MLIFTLVFTIDSQLNLPVATSRFSSGRFSNGFRSVNHGPIANGREEANYNEFSTEDEVCCHESSHVEISLVYKLILRRFPSMLN